MPFWLLQKGEKPARRKWIMVERLAATSCRALGVLILSTIAKTVIRGHSMLVVIFSTSDTVPRKTFDSRTSWGSGHRTDKFHSAHLRGYNLAAVQQTPF